MNLGAWAQANALLNQLQHGSHPDYDSLNPGADGRFGTADDGAGWDCDEAKDFGERKVDALSSSIHDTGYDSAGNPTGGELDQANAIVSCIAEDVAWFGDSHHLDLARAELLANTYAPLAQAERQSIIDLLQRINAISFDLRNCDPIALQADLDAFFDAYKSLKKGCP